MSIAQAFKVGVGAFEFAIPRRLNTLGENISLHNRPRQQAGGYEGPVDAAQRMNVHYNNPSSN